LQQNDAVARRQHHAVIQLVGNCLGAVLQRDEVEYVIVLVQRPLDLDGDAVVVAMQALALVAFVADEVPRAEDEVVLADTHVKTFRHGPRSGKTPDITTPSTLILCPPSPQASAASLRGYSCPDI